MNLSSPVERERVRSGELATDTWFRFNDLSLAYTSPKLALILMLEKCEVRQKLENWIIELYPVRDREMVTPLT